MSAIKNESTASAYVPPAVEGALGEAKESTLSAARGVKSAVSDGAEAIAGKARETYASAVKNVKSAAEDPSKMVEALRDIVRDHPLAAIATVAVASMLVGRMIMRSST